MNPELQLRIVAAATAVHQACANVANGSTGTCREAAFALALMLGPLEDNAALICQGVVATDDGPQEHFWCRIGHVIADPTADQFPGQSGPLIASEVELAHYKEDSFLLLSHDTVFQILDAAKLIRLQKGAARSPDRPR